MAKKEKLSDDEAEDIDDLSSDEGDGGCCDADGTCSMRAKKSTNKQPKPKKIKWSAVFMLALFVVPALFGAVAYLYDMFYPEEALARRVRDKVTRCYEVANPSKLSEVEKIIKKYEGKEAALFNQLRAKYEKFDECQ